MRMKFAVPALIILSQCLSAGDAAVMTIALAGIGHALHAGPAALQWILSAELLTCGGFLILGGRLADLLGIRRMFLLGAALFTLGALPGLLSTNLLIILPGRVLAGLGIACINPAALGLIVGSFPEGLARDRAFGLFSLGQSIGFFGGMMLGGVIVSLTGWHGAFGIDALLGAACLALGLPSLPAAPARQSLRGLDLPGAVTVTLGLGLVIYVLSALGSGASLVGAALAGAVLLLAAFTVIERRARQPLLPFGVFRAPNLVIAAVLLLLFNALAIATLVTALFFAQRIAHMPPAGAILLFLPALLVSLTAARLVPRVLARVSPQVVAAGGFVAYLGMVLVVLGYGQALAAPHFAFALALLGVCLSSAGAVTGIITLFGAASAGAPAAQRGVVSAVLLAVSQIGAAAGVAAGAATLAWHPPGGLENFPLTYLTIAGTALLGCLLVFAFFRATQPQAAVRAH